MARIGWVPYDADWEDQKEEERAERRAQYYAPVSVPKNDPRFGVNNPEDPEFASVEDCAEYILDNDRTQITVEELACLNYRLNEPVAHLISALSLLGVTLAPRKIPERIRGFKDRDLRPIY